MGIFRIGFFQSSLEAIGFSKWNNFVGKITKITKVYNFTTFLYAPDDSVHALLINKSMINDCLTNINNAVRYT